MSICLFLGGYEEEALEASAKATEAQGRAETAETRVQVIVDQLPEDQRRVNQIPLDIQAANRDVRDAHSQVTITHCTSTSSSSSSSSSTNTSTDLTWFDWFDLNFDVLNFKIWLAYL